METKKRSKRLLSLILCMMVTICMCFTFSDNAYAAEEEMTPAMPAAELAAPVLLDNGASVTAVESADIAAATAYVTPEAAKYTTFSYNVVMPQKGTLVIQYAVSSDPSCYVKAEGSGVSYASNANFGDTQGKLFYVPYAGNVTVSFSLSSGAAVFSAWYVADGKAVPADGTAVLIGADSTNAESTFSVTVPSSGYLTVYAANGIESYSVKMKAPGFKDWEYMSSSNGYSTSLGVKKGTYTISLKGASVYEVSTTFHSVKETSAKASKKKAASIKKGKLNKALIPVSSQKKVHWYKIRNPKNQKLRLAVNAKKMSGGGGYGKLKITVYFPNKTKRYETLSAGYSNLFTVTYGTGATTKARKGTYYVKVEGISGANGYFTLKWK